ncbi:nitronate monooxygenase [Sporichthya polymorpha]|uniref:nitronate monooxygenase n=1 Tax=Sporichthya polymorpha TaxID=35751 RepID=UPI0003646192|nr:nitronate monooxygenase [Sporichthya polymorpha]
MRTVATELLGIEHPLIGFSRSPGVVAAVSRAGGLGVLGATAYTPEQLDAQLTWITEQVEGKPFGVDVLIPAKSVPGDPANLIASLRAQIPAAHIRFVDELLAKYEIPADAGKALFTDDLMAGLAGNGAEALLEVAFRHPLALVANALGPAPEPMLRLGREHGVPVAALVGSPKHAQQQLERGVDLLIAQGTEAGGHTGTIATMVLTPEIVELAGDTPVLAAGGIASGAQMAAALALGAAGVWCGSVWLRSEEDITPREIKEKFLAAGSSSTLRSPTRTGKPARQLRSAWHDAWESSDAPPPLPMPLQPLLVNDAWNRIDAAAEAGHPGALELESFFIGQVVGRFRQLEPAYDIATGMIRDCEARLREVAALVTP